MPNDEDPYRVSGEGRACSVLDASGITIMTCGDKANAEQYAALMNQAYREGFKEGYRAGKRASLSAEA